MRGAQKKTVLGPAGWFMNDENLEVAAVDAAPDIVLFEETGTRGGGVLKSV